MKFYKNLIVSTLISCGFVFPATATWQEDAIIWLNANIDVDAPEIIIKQSCLNGDGSTTRNCIEDGWSLTLWLDDIRKPNITKPLKVNIHPGNYSWMYIKMTCDAGSDYTGFVSFVGSGSEVTTITANSNPINIKNCTNLEFSNFGIKTSYHYMNWHGGGTSRWSDMDIKTQGGSWREHTCGAERGSHYWYSSKLSFGAAGNDLGYTATCDESWFYGSEIAFGGPFYAHQNGHAISAKGAGEIHVYGGNISGTNIKGLEGGLIKASNGGKIHIHGTGIDLKPAATATGNANIFEAETGGLIHANGNAFAVDFSSPAIVNRISENLGTVIAPYNWGALTNPPPVVSKTGSDIVIETDCSAATCDDNGSQPHTLVYDASCAAHAGGPWLDTFTKACRGE